MNAAAPTKLATCHVCERSSRVPASTVTGDDWCCSDECREEQGKIGEKSDSDDDDERARRVKAASSRLRAQIFGPEMPSDDDLKVEGVLSVACN